MLSSGKTYALGMHIATSVCKSGVAALADLISVKT